ncbi:hypothetical protein SLEP1_g45198 [Rubroshorea leprosula]|uniref:Uncharacterized protein n=1 Tax=Rubroshorea leprosula TaxID=152421 RepID=A0AAV5LJ06_9ROSI|nr:hypothetical protein SLEP1_g45198 [Rubroshorea leprosula]
MNLLMMEIYSSILLVEVKSNICGYPSKMFPPYNSMILSNAARSS